jgi:hypothetical protein
MSSFLDFIKEKIPTIFTEERTSPFSKTKQYTDADSKTMDEINHEHELLINKIVNDVINFFMNDKDKDTYVLELLEPSVCNDLTLLLTKDLEDRFKSYAIDKFRNDISVSKNKHKPCTTRDSCTKQLKETIVSENPRATKWDLCYAVASHYVKMLNVLAAILTGISPEKNMCIERMNSIYKVVDLPNGTQGFEINICRTTTKKAVKERLFEENGLRELINLYILEHMDKILTDADIKIMESEYKKLVNTLNNSGLLTKKITIRDTSVTESSSKNNTLTKTQPIPTVSNSNSLLVDKIKTFQDVVKLTESKSKSVKLTPELLDDLNYLKAASKKLSTLVNNKKVSSNSISNTLNSILSKYKPKYSSEYTSSSSANISSEYESEVNSYSSENSDQQQQQQQIVLYIGDAYNKLNEIKSSSSSFSSSSSAESNYNTTNETSEEASEYDEESEYNEEEEEEAINQQGGFEDKEDSLAKFNNFIKKYKEYWSPEIRKYFDELINNGFNSGAVTDVCNAAKVNNKDIFIDIADIYDIPTLTDFLDNFNDMKVDYMASCDKLIYILENDLLEQIKEKRSIKYSFRNLSTDELRVLQKKCRATLLEMYTKNHEYYLKGIGLLKRYFTSSFYKKAKNNTVES